MRLLSDPEFVKLYSDVIQALDDYRSRPRWFAQQGAALAGPVAYFSMEFGIHESLGHLLGRPGRPGRRPLQGGERPRRAARRRGAALPLRLLPPDGRRRRLPAAHLPRLRLRAAAGAAGAGPGGRSAHGPDRPPRPRRARRGVEGAGGPGAGADARHRHPAQRPGRPPDHRRRSTCAAARCGCARRSCSASAACARCARSASTPPCGT